MVIMTSSSNSSNGLNLFTPLNTGIKAHLGVSHQARDEVITVLKAQMTDAALLEAHYAFRGPEKVIRALRRDSLQAQKDQLQDVYEKPMAEVGTIRDHWQEYKHTKLMLMNRISFCYLLRRSPTLDS